MLGETTEDRKMCQEPCRLHHTENSWEFLAVSTILCSYAKVRLEQMRLFELLFEGTITGDLTKLRIQPK